MMKVVNSNEFKSEIEKDMVLVDFAEWWTLQNDFTNIDELQLNLKIKLT